VAKVMISMPDDLLARLDGEAERRATSRSALLAEAARRELERRDPRAVAGAVERSLARFRNGIPFDAAEIVRTERDTPR